MTDERQQTIRLGRDGDRFVLAVVERARIEAKSVETILKLRGAESVRRERVDIYFEWVVSVDAEKNRALLERDGYDLNWASGDMPAAGGVGWMLDQSHARAAAQYQGWTVEPVEAEGRTVYRLVD